MSRLTYGEMRSRTERIADEGIKEGVQQGLKLLQEKFGDDWVEKIDCKTLNLRNSAQCVLGQIYGTYEDGMDWLGIEDDDNHGFTINEERSWSGEDGGYDYDLNTRLWTELDEAWHAVLCDKEAIPGGAS